jgi:hypothetical protein
MVPIGRTSSWTDRGLLRIGESRLATKAMKPLVSMAAISVVSWIGATAIVDWRTSVEFLFGMLAPLVAAIGTWLLTAWAYKENPEQLTGLMATSFILKMIFFAAYVAFMLRVIRLRPVPFVGSFTGYFVGLYLMEALYMKRLFSERSR